MSESEQFNLDFTTQFITLDLTPDDAYWKLNQAMALLCTYKHAVSHPQKRPLSLLRQRVNCPGVPPETSEATPLEAQLPIIIAPLRDPAGTVQLTAISRLSELNLAPAQTECEVAILSDEDLALIQMTTAELRQAYELERFKYAALLVEGDPAHISGPRSGAWLRGLKSDSALQDFTELLYGSVLWQPETLPKALRVIDDQLSQEPFAWLPISRLFGGLSVAIMRPDLSPGGSTRYIQPESRN